MRPRSRPMAAPGMASMGRRLAAGGTQRPPAKKIAAPLRLQRLRTACLRQAAGGSPNSRLKARLNAASDS